MMEVISECSAQSFGANADSLLPSLTTTGSGIVAFVAGGGRRGREDKRENACRHHEAGTGSCIQATGQLVTFSDVYYVCLFRFQIVRKVMKFLFKFGFYLKTVAKGTSGYGESPANRRTQHVSTLSKSIHDF
jgi:hypothetical protein